MSDGFIISPKLKKLMVQFMVEKYFESGTLPISIFMDIANYIEEKFELICLSAAKVKDIVSNEIFNDICQNNYGFETEIVDKIEQNIRRICAQSNEKVERVPSQETTSSNKSIYQDAVENLLSVSTTAQHGSAESSSKDQYSYSPISDDQEMTEESSSLVASNQTVINCNLNYTSTEQIQANEGNVIILNEQNDIEVSLNIEQTFAQFDNQKVFTSTQNHINVSPNIFCAQNDCLTLDSNTPPTPSKTLTPQRQEADSSQNPLTTDTLSKNINHVMKTLHEYGELFIKDYDITDDLKTYLR